MQTLAILQSCEYKPCCSLSRFFFYSFISGDKVAAILEDEMQTLYKFFLPSFFKYWHLVCLCVVIKVANWLEGKDHFVIQMQITENLTS